MESRHFTMKDWILYAQNKTEPSQIHAMEAHLRSCDHCLNMYLKAIENNVEVTNTLNETSKKPSGDFSDKVINKINEGNRRKKKSLKKVMTYYAIAASITFLLMVTGAFNACSFIPKGTDAFTNMSARVQSTLQQNLTNTMHKYKFR